MIATRSSFYQAEGGSLAHDAPSYVERAADRELFDALCQGEFCYVLTSRQMGKSSLMVRTTHRLRESGQQVVVLDLSAMGENLSAEQWYLGLLGVMGTRLGLEDELDDFWFEHEQLGPLRRWMEALRQVVLKGSDESKVMSDESGPSTHHSSLITHHSRLVIFIDEIDVVQSLPFSTDEFFAAIRECYNRRTEDPAFEAVTFCLLGVASPSDLIRDTRTTPFNIGRRIELHDFTKAEAAPLRIGLTLGTPETLGMSDGEAGVVLERILYWTGGHPYLTQRLCRAVVDRQATRVGQAVSLPVGEDRQADSLPHRRAATAEVDRFCGELFLSTRAREQDDNLLFVRNWMLKEGVDRASLLDLYGQVRQGQRVGLDSTSPLVERLRLAGIVRVEEPPALAPSLPRSLARPRLLVRNRIYERVFDGGWVAQHMPDAEVRRQQRAYRKGLLRTAAVAGLILIAMGAAGISALRQNQLRLERLQLQQEARMKQVALVGAQSERDRARQSEASERQQKVVARQAEQRASRNANEAKAAAQQAQQAQQRAETERQRADVAAGRALRASAQEAQQRRRAVGLSAILDRDKRRQFYASQMRLAYDTWEAGHVTDAQNLLAALVPGPGQEELRGFECRYLWRLSRQDNALATLATQRGGAALDDVLFSPDGRTLVTTGYPRVITLWDVASRRKIGTLAGVREESPGLAFSPDGRLLATGCRDRTIQLWDFASRRIVASLPSRLGERGALAFSPDGKLLAAISQDRKAVKLWDVQARQDIVTLPEQEKGAICLAFSPDDRFLAVAGNDRMLRLWDVSLRRVVATLEDVEDKVSSLAFSPDGETLATGGSRTGKVRLWDLRSRRLTAVLAGHGGGSVAVAFSPDGQWLATGGTDWTVRLWSIATRNEVATFRGHRGGVPAVAFSPDGSLLASAGWPPDGSAKLWRVSLQDRDLLTGHRNIVQAVTYSPDGATLISGSGDGSIKLWTVSTGRETATLQGGVGVGFIALQPGGKLLAVGGPTTATTLTLTIWDLQAQREFATVKREGSGRFPVAFSPNGRILAFGSDPNTVRLYDVATRQEIAALKGPPLDANGDKASVDCLAFSPDGRLLAAGGPQRVHLWDVASRKEVAGHAGKHARSVSAVTFSPDGKLLVTGGVESEVKIWSVQDRHEVATLKGHTDTVAWVGFAPDGKTLASSSFDGTLRFWSTASWLEVVTLKEPLRNPYAVAFSPNGDAMAVGRTDQTIRLLRAAPFAEADHEMTLAWHRQSAEKAFREERWSAAIPHLSSLLQVEPQNPLFLQQRGASYASLGQWRRAAADFTRLTALEPNDWRWWRFRALCQLALADTPAYRKVCAEKLRFFAKSDQPVILNSVAWTCVLGRAAVDDPRIPVRWAERAVARSPDSATFLTTLGAAHYRAGRWTEAIERLNEAQAHTEWAEVRVPNGVFLAMAHSRLGHAAEARRWLDNAVAWMEPMLQRKPGDPGEDPLPWNRRLALSLPWHEAEALIQSFAETGKHRRPVAPVAHH